MVPAGDICFLAGTQAGRSRVGCTGDVRFFALAKVCSWHILLQKSFRNGERKFLDPLMRFTRGDAWGPYRFIQNRSRTSVVALRARSSREAQINFDEISGLYDSTFGTISAPLRHARLSRECPFTGIDRKSSAHGQNGEIDPYAVRQFSWPAFLRVQRPPRLRPPCF